MAGSRLSKLADELEGLEDEITKEDLLDAVKTGATLATESGRFRAMNDTPTKPDNEAPESDVPPPSAGKAAPIVAVLRAVNNPYALGALALLVVALWVWLTNR